MFDLPVDIASIAGQLLPPLPQSTFLVTTTIKVDGTAIPTQFGVDSIRVYKAANKIPFAILHLHDGDPAKQKFSVSDSNFFTPGKKIQILAGYHNKEKTIFEGIVIRHGIKIKQGTAPMLEIECKDPAVKMTVDRKNKYFYNQKDSEIIKEVLGNYGFDLKTDATKSKHREMVQYAATDWDFIIQRAEANARLVFCNNGKLTIKKPDFKQTPKFNLNYGTSIYEYEAEMDARDQYPKAKAMSWKPGDQQLIDSEANAQGPVGGGLLGDIGSAISKGADAIESVAAKAGINLDLPGTRPDTDFTKVLDVKQMLLQHPGDLSPEELQSWAEAQYTKSELAKLRGRVKFQGIDSLVPGDCITVQGVGQRHEGKVYVTAVSHEIGRGGWFTQAQFGLPQRWFAEEYDVSAQPASALLPAVHGLQIGVVNRLAPDPDGEDRIQVRLPMVDNEGEGVWSRIACQDAGNDRGSFFRPEIGDEVIVGFLNDDPREAIVLGMLNSSANPAHLNANDQNHEKGWKTRSKMKMIFNDDKKSLVIETPKGKKITIDENADKIKIEDEHQNSITMDANGIVIEAGQNLTLKAGQNLKIEAPNITQSAQSSFKAEAQGQAQLIASGDVVVKGAFVRIN